MPDLIVTCPACSGKFNGRNVTHSHGGSLADPRFASCQRCHGQGAITCEKCEGAGRIIMRDGVQVGTHAKPATSPVLGPRPPKKVSGGPR